MNNILTRRTIRKYSTKDVDNELLRDLLTKASRTQTMGNMQLYSVIVTRSEKGKKADFRRATDWCMHRKADPGYDNFLSFINASTDALLYTQTFCNLAEEAGLGLCFLGTTVYMPEMIIDALKLPQLVMPAATLTVGWPDEEPALTDRLPLESFVHEEAYKPYTAEAIDMYYSEKEGLEENREFVRINNKETLAQIFTDIRYTRKDNVAMSEGMIRALRRQGFYQ